MKHQKPVFVPMQVVELMFFAAVLGSLVFGYRLWEYLLG